MGQKTNPIGLRVAVNHDWRSKWYAGKKEFGKLLTEDRDIRELLKKKLESASVPQILIERAASRCRITILTARPGIVIGRKGAEIDKLKEELSKMTGKEIYVDIVEVKTPEIDAQLVAENVALQLERRVSFRRAMKKALQTAKDFGAEGIKIRCAGRLGGAELARVEQYHWGRVPLHTLRANIDYGFAEANTVYGKLGIKCWICKGDTKAPSLPAAARRGRELRIRIERLCYALDARESEVPQDAPRQPRRSGDAGPDGVLWRVRVNGAATLLAGHQATRGRPRGHSPQYEAPREDVDSHLPAEVLHQEAAGNAHGQRQRPAGIVGRGDPAGQRAV